MKNIYYRRNLPHIHPADGIFFVTARLAGSLPDAVIEKFLKEKDSFMEKLMQKYSGKELKTRKYIGKKHYFRYFDSLLEKSTTGPKWLKDSKIAHIIADNLHKYEGVRYKLICYCIMPNHIHFMIDTLGVYDYSNTNYCGKSRTYPLAETLRFIKGRTARYSNLELNRSGPFWQHKSYDHYVRNRTEFDRIIYYILQNPLKAGLPRQYHKQPFTYLATF